MTMENGEGRPLDETEAGEQDPQGWYFDLPSNAWERQEAKNRQLRERVAENIAEDAEKARHDPFVLKRPEPQPEPKGGLFGFGRKKKNQDPERPGNEARPMHRPQPAEPWDEADDDWSTEAVVPDAPPEPLTLRRRAQEGQEPEAWGPRDGGWSLGPADATPAEAAPEGEPDRQAGEHARAKSWVAADEPAEAEPGEWPTRSGPEQFVTATDETAEEPASDVLGGLRAWAQADTGPAEAPRTEIEDSAPEAPAGDNRLQLRRSTDDDSGKRLNWDFGPAAWSEPGETAPTGPANGPEMAPPDEPAGMMESMRRWAERNKEETHSSSFVLRHRDEAEPEGTPEPPAIPVRPRRTDDSDAHEPVAFQPGAPLPPANPDVPPSLPLVLRSRTEPQPDQPPADPGAPPSRWDEFFGLSQPEAAEETGESAEPRGISEGLSAMKDWAAKKAESEPPHGIPPEFLKPFDWETEEDDTGGSAEEIPAEFLKPFEWETEPAEDDAEPAAPTAVAWESAPAEEDAPAAFAWESPAEDDAEPAAPAAFAWESAPAEEAMPTAFAWESPAEEDAEQAATTTFAWESAPAEEAAPAAFAWESPAEEDPEPAAPAFTWASAPAEETAPTAFAWESPDEEVAEDEPAPVSQVHHMPALAAPTAGEDDAFEDDPLAGIFDHATATPVVQPEKEKKGGLFGRMFGRGKRHEETPATGAPSNDWLFVEPEDADVRTSAPAARLHLAGQDLAPEPDSATLEPSEAGSLPDEDEWAAFRVADEPEEIVVPVASFDAPEVGAPVTVSFTDDADDDGDWSFVPDEAEETAVPVASFDAPEVGAPVTVSFTDDADDDGDWSFVPDEPEEIAVPVASLDAPEVEAPVTVSVTDDADDDGDWSFVADEPDEIAVPVASLDAPEVESPVTVSFTNDADDDEAWAPEPVALENSQAVAVEKDLHEAMAEPTADADWRPRQLTLDTVASTEPTEEPVAGETPWWEQAEADAPAEIAASVEPTVEEPLADEKPWWEQAESETPAEAVASVEPTVEEPVADEKPWWQQAEADAPAETAASVEPTVEEPVADEKPWWERAEADAPAEPVASVESTVEEPVADEKPWWEQAEADAPAAEPAASVEPTVEEPVAEDDDPWAAFVGGESRDEHVAPVIPSFAASTPPTWPANPVPDRDEDMWGDIAAQAEEAASAADDAGIDLAASLESQMAAASDRPAEWERGGRTFEREAGSPGTYATDEDGTFEDADDDVILRAFERHAATPDAEPALQRETEEALAELFGNNAAQIVDGPENEAEPQSFMRLGGFAPQRGSEAFDGNWGPEQEEIDALERGRRMHGGSDGGFIVAPWDGDEIDAEAAHAGSGAKLKTWVRELVETGLLALLVFLSVRASFQNFKVDGNSMLPTLEDGQFLIVNKLVYSEVDMEKLGKYVPFINADDDEQRHIFHGPERGDIVVLRDPRKPETDLIKRVIGLPGETVEIVNGKVFINDMLLEEPYITTPWNDTKTKILIPEGEYYVLGDNRDNSLDSRSSQVGLVPEDLIIGKAMLSYWPRDKFGLAANEEGSLTEQKPVLTTQRIGAD